MRSFKQHSTHEYCKAELAATENNYDAFIARCLKRCEQIEEAWTLSPTVAKEQFDALYRMLKTGPGKQQAVRRHQK